MKITSIQYPLMRMVCSQCESPNMYCKGLCQACYSKKRRSTEKGKQSVKKYNSTKGKEAQKRYRERMGMRPRLPKQNCACGKQSVAKGLCLNCYQRKKYGHKERLIKNKADTENIFISVLNEVKKGFTIERACKISNVNRGYFYKIISGIQKTELNMYKKLGVSCD